MFFVENGKKLILSSKNGVYTEIGVNQLVEINLSDGTYIKGPISEIDFNAEGFWVSDTTNNDKLAPKWNEKYDGQVYFYLCDIKLARFLKSEKDKKNLGIWLY